MLTMLLAKSMYSTSELFKIINTIIIKSNMSNFTEFLIEKLTVDSTKFDLTKSKWKSLYDKEPSSFDSYSDGDLVKIIPDGKTWTARIENYDETKVFKNLPTIEKAVDRAIRYCENLAKADEVKIRLFAWHKREDQYEFGVKYVP